MIRFTICYVIGGSCFDCGEKGEAIITDRKTGEDYFVCKKHLPKQSRVARNQLHPYFAKSKPVLHTKKPENRFNEQDVHEVQGVLK